MKKIDKYKLILSILAFVLFVVVLVVDIIDKVSFLKVLVHLLPYVVVALAMLPIKKKEVKEEKKEEKKEKPTGIYTDTVKAILEEESTKEEKYQKIKKLRLDDKISSKEYQKAIEKLDE